MSGDLIRSGDKAQFAAEPMPEGGVLVKLLSITPDPLGAIAAGCLMYQGRVVRDYGEISDGERERCFRQLLHTKLKAPFELVNMHWLIEGVDRAFTHQLVRARTAVFMQESLRFAVKTEVDAEVGLPPSLDGLPEDDPSVVVYRKAIRDAGASYLALVEAGMPAEEARALLPHATLTRVHMGIDYRALLDHAGNRLCTQAQFIWRRVFSEMARELRRAGHPLLASALRPVCYQTGRCEFNSTLDRHCSIRERVAAHAAKGEGPELWTDIWTTDWALDPGAART